MEGIKLFPIFLAFFLVIFSFVIANESVCPTEDKSERREILAQLADIGSTLASYIKEMNDRKCGEAAPDKTSSRDKVRVKHPKRKSKHGLDCHDDCPREQGNSTAAPTAAKILREERPPLLLKSGGAPFRASEVQQDSGSKAEVLRAAVHSTGNSNGVDKDLEKRQARIQKLLLNAKATFFTEEDMKGSVVAYDSKNTTYEGGCQAVSKVKSMAIGKSCIRLFSTPFCYGMSRAIYPKPDSGSFINFLALNLTSVGSVGTCIWNEFEFASISVNEKLVTATKDVSNIQHVPDLVNFDSKDAYIGINYTSISSSRNPITHYRMENGRPKWIRAAVKKTHVKSTTDCMVRLNTAIPPELGGPRNEAYNSFSQTMYNLEMSKRRIVNPIQKFLKTANSTETAWAYITFQYKDSTAAHPYGFVFLINFNDKRKYYGFIRN